MAHQRGGRGSGSRTRRSSPATVPPCMTAAWTQVRGAGLLKRAEGASYAIASRKSYSHILQFAVSLGQLYGCLLYFITAYLDGFNFWISPFYFWSYFIGSNSSWVIIPTLIATRSWKKISAAFQAEKIKTR